MDISEDARSEIDAVLEGGFRLPPSYHDFFIKWLVFNRVYNELSSKKDEKERVIECVELIQSHWNEVDELAKELVKLECVGGELVPDEELLAPKTEVKSATLYLRQQLGLAPAVKGVFCTTVIGCRPDKQELCSKVNVTSWNKGEMAALLRILYQVRCNFIHGDKRLSQNSPQTKRDKDLLELSGCILGRVLTFVLNDSKSSEK